MNIGNNERIEKAYRDIDKWGWFVREISYFRMKEKHTAYDEFEPEYGWIIMVEVKDLKACIKREGTRFLYTAPHESLVSAILCSCVLIIELMEREEKERSRLKKLEEEMRIK